MNYCAHCGKFGARERGGKLWFHAQCVREEPLFVVEPDAQVKAMNDNRIHSELRFNDTLIRIRIPGYAHLVRVK